MNVNDLCTKLIYECINVLVHGSDNDIRVLNRMLYGFRDLLDLVIGDLESYILKKESEKENA